MKRISILLLAISLLGCTPKDSSSTDGSTKTADSLSAPQGSLYQNPYHDVKALVRAWNKGINQRDWALLESTYAQEVYYYGSKLSQTEALQHKKAALQKAPQFVQTVADINIQRLYHHTQEAFFLKAYSHDATRQDTVVGILAFHHDPQQGWKITQESDHLSRSRQGNKVCSCSEFLVALYNNGDATAYQNIHFFEGEPYYTSDDGQYYLFVYPDEEEVVFLEKENKGSYAAALGAAHIFSMKDQKMRRATYSAQEEEVVGLNQVFLGRLGEFCR